MTPRALWSAYPERLVLALFLVLPNLFWAQEAQRTPPPRPVLNPQPFQPNISTTEDTAAPVEAPNSFSPWYDVTDATRLPDYFDPTAAAKSATEGQAEAAAAAMSEPSDTIPNVPFADLFIENTEGSLLATPEGSAFTSESLLLAPGGSGYDNFSKEASLPYGEDNYPGLYVPRAVPVFKRVRTLLPVGPVRIGIDAGAAVAYNDNVFALSSHPKGDLIYSFLPVVYLEAGTKGLLQIIYEPTFINYATYHQLSSTNQQIFVRARYPFSKLKVGVDAFYIDQSGLFLNSDGFAEQKTMVGRIFAEYPITEKVSAFVLQENTAQDSDPGGSVLEDFVLGRMYYQYSDHAKVGFSLKAGMTSAPADNQTYQQASLIASYHPNLAMIFSAEAGMEQRQIDLDDRNHLSIPTFNFQFLYNPRSTTIFTLRFYRDTLNTTFNDVSLDVNTGFNASLVMFLYQKLHLRLELGAGYTEQYSSQSDQDGHFYFTQGGITLSYPLLRMMEIQLFTNFQQQFGNQIGSDYISRTFGLGVTYKF